MKTGYSRRTVLRGIGHSAALGTLVAALPRDIGAAEAGGAEESYCLTTLYLSGDGARFDADAYRDQHVLTLKNAYGDAIERIELRVAPLPVQPPAPPPVEGEEPPPPPPPPPEPPFLAASSMWIKDLNKFVDAIRAHGQTIGADIAKVTSAKTIVQLDRVAGQLGDERSAIVVGTSCFSQYFQAGEVPDKGPARFDADGYASTLAPKMFTAFGPEAVQRMEIAQGAAAVGGGTLMLLGSVHLYIVDETKFQTAASTEYFAQLQPEEAQYRSAAAYRTLMLVHAVG